MRALVEAHREHPASDGRHNRYGRARVLGHTALCVGGDSRGARERGPRGLPEPAGTTRCQRPGLQVGYGGERVGSRIIDRRHVDGRCRPRTRFVSWSRSAARTAGMRSTDSGGCVGSSTCWSAASACAAAALCTDLQVGDAVDFWRVEAIEPGRRLRLPRRDEAARPRLAGVQRAADEPRARITQPRPSMPGALPAAPTGTASTHCTRSSSGHDCGGCREGRGVSQCHAARRALGGLTRRRACRHARGRFCPRMVLRPSMPAGTTANITA